MIEAFESGELVARQQEANRPYLEFLRKNSMSAGLYVLAANGVDQQKPHSEDEAYYVVSGRGVIRVGEEESPVHSGSFIFVAAGVEHHFHSISEELTLLVFFAPAEYAKA